MSAALREKRVSLNAAAAVGLGLALAASLAFLGFLLFGPQGRPSGVFGRAVERVKVLSRMQAALHAAVEGEKSAVLAETDEESRLFAEQAANATLAVEQARRELAPLVDAEGSPKDKELLAEFTEAFAAFRKIDTEILELAVQNTNLKAARISRGPAREALLRLDAALEGLRRACAGHAAERKIATLAYEIQLAALHILVQHAPHIAEPDEKRMDEIEQDMRAADARIKTALEGLPVLVPAAGKPMLEAARAALSDFDRDTREVLRLSRQNTNVRSLALSLGQKRKVAARCEEILAALQEGAQATLFKGTR